MKIFEMRERARRQLGERFDVRVCHHALLRDASLPLDVREADMDQWVAAEKRRGLNS
jgi:uncharacterized protein (DUF885 family)